MSTNFKELEGKFYKYIMPENLKEEIFLKKDRDQTQPAPTQWFKTDSPFVVDWQREGKGWSVQCVFSLAPNYQNNHYFVFIYNWNSREITQVCFPSLTQLPPVWDRAFGGVDYVDYLFIQNHIQQYLKSEGIHDFIIDDSLDNRYVHLITKGLQETCQLIEEGKSYGILALQAQAAKEKGLIR